jgi:ribosomal protein L24E
MVLKTTVCRFSGLRIYPGKGILFVRVDSQQYLFLSKKCKSLYNARLRPAKLAWTLAYRKQHKKDQVRRMQRAQGGAGRGLGSSRGWARARAAHRAGAGPHGHAVRSPLHGLLGRLGPTPPGLVLARADH